MPHKPLASGLAAIVIIFTLFWATLGWKAGGSGSRGAASPEQNTSQKALVAESSPSCSSNVGNRLGMANPAATYCKELGYEYRITQTGKGEQGICVFPDGTECEEWKFLAGKCGKERSYCAKQGLDQVTKADGKNSLSREYAACLDGGQEVGSVSDLMGLSQKTTRGSVPVTASEPPADQAPITGLPPASFDWRSQNGQNWMTSVKDQGSCGSCWAFSSVGVIEGDYNIQSGNPNLDLDLAEEYLVSDCYTMGSYGNCCGGSYVDALTYVRNNGIPDEACMAYVDRSSCTCSASCDSNCTYRSGGACSDATCSNRCADWQSRMVSIKSVAAVPPEEIRQYTVDQGPLVASMGVGSGYGGSFDAQGVYRCTNDSGANHAIVIVGYDDAGGYWIVKNSWGAGWNGDGYFKVGYGECAIEAWVYDVTTPDISATATPTSQASPTQTRTPTSAATPTPTPTSCPGDTDCDGVLDSVDNCPTVYNPDQLNTDRRRPNGTQLPGDWASNPASDSLGDACDPDDDNDGVLDVDENGLSCPAATIGDSDADRALDGYERASGTDACSAASKPVCRSGTDSDGDGLSDCVEHAGYNTSSAAGDPVPGYSSCANPQDSDGDGCSDMLEVIDINGDRRVNVSDVYLAARRSGGFIPSSDSDAVFDFNKDGKISVGDLYLISTNTCGANPGQLGCPVCPPE